MSLSSYNEKRNFSETSEPKGREKSSSKKLRFVIQKHDASHLHYDFRLEMKGVLKSWAIPKGPSLNPSDKRLAMMVEDHPYDYRHFEGIIPEGNYGAGTVIVWDEGSYELAEAGESNKNEVEKKLLKGLHYGNLKIVLHGKKIKGLYSLRKLKKEGDEKSWLLIKASDEYAGTDNVLQQDKSVKSGKTIAQVAKENGTEPNHPEEKNEVNIKTTRPQKKKAEAKKSTTSKGSKKSAAKQKKSKASLATSGLQLNISDGKDQVIALNKQEVNITSLNKIYWKKEGVTKLDSINYYFKMAPYILPYLIGRPQSLNRHPNGIDAPNFFQKDMKGNLSEWMQFHTDYSESTGEDVRYLVCNSEAALIYMANLGCIEMNPWHSRSASWKKPDWCLIDLDPEGVDFSKVIDCALVIKKVLDAIGADGYIKTSGSTGMHIYIPLGAKYTFEQSRQLAELIVTMVHQEMPESTSLERNPAKRKKKVYLDYLQNSETQTAAAPYSLRPKRGMPVSTPLHWDEVKSGLTATTYTMKNIFERVKAEGDLFKPVLGKGINLRQVLKKVQSLLE